MKLLRNFAPSPRHKFAGGVLSSASWRNVYSCRAHNNIWRCWRKRCCFLTTPCAASYVSSQVADSHKGKQRVVVLTGPTGVGKTKISLALAEHLNAEIISADSVQVYTGLDIGSDKVVKSRNENPANKHPGSRSTRKRAAFFRRPLMSWMFLFALLVH
jgi:hypothetical protein